MLKPGTCRVASTWLMLHTSKWICSVNPNTVGGHKCRISNFIDIVSKYTNNLKPVTCRYQFTSHSAQSRHVLFLLLQDYLDTTCYSLFTIRWHMTFVFFSAKNRWFFINNHLPGRNVCLAQTNNYYVKCFATVWSVQLLCVEIMCTSYSGWTIVLPHKVKTQYLQNINHSRYIFLMSNFASFHFHTKRLYAHNVWYSRYSL